MSVCAETSSIGRMELFVFVPSVALINDKRVFQHFKILTAEYY